MSNTTKEKNLLIMAGGTGGHIFPALAIANTIRQHGVTLNWLGSKNGMENTIVPQHGIDLHTVSSVGLRGKNFLTLIKAPFQLANAFFQTMKVFKQVQPDVVMGMGGFASGIGGVVAWLHGIPLVIHEQNSIPGSTNKALSKIATQVFQAFDNSFDDDKVITSGNPVLFKPKKKNAANKKINLLILGGSLGAKPINDIASQLNVNANIWHQTGKQHLDTVKAQCTNKSAKIVPFIDDMAKAYAWADVVICRAGAMTISELMLSGSASILIPLPHAIDNHQFFNAKILSDNNAGILIEQKELSQNQLENLVNSLDKAKLALMGEEAKKLAKVDANEIITQYLLSV